MVLVESRRLQATLLSNRAEAFLRTKPPRLTEAAASARAALHIDPSNEKAQRRLERADPNLPAKSTPRNGGGLRGGKRNGTVAPAGGWRGVLIQTAKRSGAQTIAMLILLAVMATIQAVFGPSFTLYLPSVGLLSMTCVETDFGAATISGCCSDGGSNLYKCDGDDYGI